MSKTKTLAQRIAADPKLRAKYLKNPGLRSKLPDTSLTPELRQRRADNAFNAQPITQGSTITNAQLGREANAATLLAYGSAGRDLQAQQSREVAVGRDTAGWYDTYRRELQQHAANTQAINSAAVGQIGQLGAGMRGLDQTSVNAQQGAANADAATRGASAADLGPEASNASLVRQQMLANFGVQQVGLGAAANRYADTAAHVVAPTQQLQARAQSAQNVRDVGRKITDLKQTAGAFNQDYRNKRTADEAKNVIALAALNNDISNTKTDNQQAKANAAETRRSHTISAGQRAAGLAETVRSHRAGESAAQERIRIQREKAKGAARKPATREAHANAKSQIDYAQTWIKDLRKRGVPDAQISALLTVGQSPGTQKGTGGKPDSKIPKIDKTDRDFVNAARDLLDKGELSPANVKALHRRGLSLKDLGYPTVTGRRKKATRHSKGGIAKALDQGASDLDQLRRTLRP